ncbi:hypothetical protein ACQJBY_032065 [Aegilops geniculata]
MARAAGVPTATLFSQLCSVAVIYGEVYAGRFDPPVMEGGALRGLLSGGSVVICGSTGVIPAVAGCSGRPVRRVCGRRRCHSNSFHELDIKGTRCPTRYHVVWVKTNLQLMVVIKLGRNLFVSDALQVHSLQDCIAPS